MEEERVALAQEVRDLQDQYSNAALLSEQVAPLEKAQKECEELESKLAQQSKTLKELEESKSKFQHFAQKYEQEIAKRDEIIKTLSPGQNDA